MQRAVILQGAAAVLELLSEPLYILSMARMRFKLRMACETAATIVKNGSTLALLSFGIAPALAFSWAQIGYATVLLAGYSGHFVVLRRESIWSSAEAHQEGSSRLQFDPAMLRTCGVFAAQAAGKLLLAEGSKAVLAATTPLQEQGVYGLVTNLGSLVVRTIFQPFEEASFLAFTRPPAETGAAGLRKRASLLCLLCRAICSLGALAATFGPAYSHVALLLLYGSKWASTDAPDALAVYSLYVALLAANGILEAFVHAVADEPDLKRANIALACISVLHIGLSVAGVKMGGAVGLLLADGGNMVLRILYCLNFISAFFASTGGLSYRDLLPARTTLGALGTALAATLVSQALFMPEESILARWSIAKAGMMPVLLMGDKIQRAVPSFAMRIAAHVGVGSVCLAGVCGVAWMEERKVILDVRRLKSKSE
jgi:oligosaccharide translocation protein RFT1